MSDVAADAQAIALTCPSVFHADIIAFALAVHVETCMESSGNGYNGPWSYCGKDWQIGVIGHGKKSPIDPPWYCDVAQKYRSQHDHSTREKFRAQRGWSKKLGWHWLITDPDTHKNIGLLIEDKDRNQGTLEIEGSLIAAYGTTRS